MNASTATLRRIAAAALASAAGLTALAGPASAETAVFKDAAGDLDHGADIRRVRVVNEDQVRIRVVHEDLVRSWESGSSIAVFLDTDRKREGAEFVFSVGPSRAPTTRCCRPRAGSGRATGRSRCTAAATR